MFLDELLRWKRLLLEPPLYALLLLTLAAGLGAYQVRQPQVVDIGGIHDAPYLSAFHDPEPDRQEVPNPDVDFRWTRERVAIDMWGVGRQPVEVRLRMQAYRPPAWPPPQASLWIGRNRFLSGPVGDQWQVYQVLLPPDLLAVGDLHLELRAETFQPAGDPRDLGVSVDWIEVRPTGVGWVGPAWSQIGCLLGATFLAYLLLRRWGLSQGGSTVLVALGSGLLAYLLAYHRLSLTYFTPTLVLLLAWGCLLTVLGLPALERWGRRERRVKEARLLWSILLLGFLLRIGGMLYPQFRSSDLIFHVHRAQFVQSGNLLFTADLPDVNLPAPYPPGLYLLYLPATLLSNDLPLLMEITGAALDAVAGLLLYLLVRRLTGRPRPALLALLLQGIAPVTFFVFSWGNYTNMFSRVALLGVLVLLVLGRWRWGQGRGWALLTGSFVLVLLGHFADSLLFVAFILAMVALGLLTPAGRRAVPIVLAALVVAGVLVLGLYYSASPVWDVLLQGLKVFLEGESRPAALVNPVYQILDHVQAPLVLLVLPGLALLPQPQWRWPAVVLGGALLTALVFAVGQALFGFSSRYTLFVLPVLALGTGLVLAALRKRSWAGRLVVGALLVYLVWNCLYLWWRTIGFGQR